MLSADLDSDEIDDNYPDPTSALYLADIWDTWFKKNPGGKSHGNQVGIATALVTLANEVRRLYAERDKDEN